MPFLAATLLAHVGGRKPVGGHRPVLTGKKAEAALYHSRTVPAAEICATLGVGRTSLCRLLQASQTDS